MGLEGEVLVAGAQHPGAANRFVLCGGKVQQLPTGALDLLRRAAGGEQLAGALLGGVLREPFARAAERAQYSTRAAVEADDESVFDFAQRRLGAKVAARMLDPLCVGVFGGDARALSLRACFPALAEMERLEGSLLLGAIRAEKNAPPLPPPEPGSERLLKRVAGARVWTLARGMGMLPAAVGQWLAHETGGMVEVRTGCAAAAVEPGAEGGVRVALADGGAIDADHVVSALPARALAALVRRSDAPLAQALGTIPTQSIAVANLIYAGAVSPVDGFGYLVPTHEEAAAAGLLGVVLDSCAFPAQDDPFLLHGRDPGVQTRLTVMCGGHRYRDVFGEREADPEGVLALSRWALREHLGIEDEPLHTNVRTWLGTMPQYTVGHLNRVEGIESHLRGRWGGRLHATGSSYRGVGVNDCVRNATQLGAALVAGGL